MDWNIAIGVLFAGPGTGLAAMAAQYYVAARVFFSITGVLLVWQVVEWGLTTTWSTPVRLSVVAIFGALIAVGTVESLLFVNKKQRVSMQPETLSAIPPGAAPPIFSGSSAADASMPTGGPAHRPFTAAKPQLVPQIIPPTAISTPSNRGGGDRYTNNGVNNGFIGRNEGTVNVGKQPFVMTNEAMSSVLAKIDRTKKVTLYAIGPSTSATNQLADYLSENGIQVAALNTIGQWVVAGIDIPQVPIIVGEPAPSAGRVPDSTPIVVDVTK